MAGNAKMVGDNTVSLNYRTRTRAFYARKCKNNSFLTNIESLPDELVFKILCHLPAQDIYDLARLVCRKWYHMIHTRHFVYEHLQHSPSGLLFQYSSHKNPIFLSLREDRVAISAFKYRFKCNVWASCNGLILEHGGIDPESLCIANPITKQHFPLPPFRTRIYHLLVGIAYAAASMEYKVVLTDFSDDKKNVVRGCAILTVGVDDSWRNVRTQHLPSKAKELLLSAPLTTEGFIHWAKPDDHQVLTMNVETEIITETPVPIPRVYVEKKRTRFLSTGRYLSFVIGLGDLKWEVWEMKPETREWRKMPNIIDMEAHKGRFEEELCDDGSLQPFGWLNYPEVLLFGIEKFNSKTCFVYKFYSGEIDSFELPDPENRLHYGLELHKNSLVWLSGLLK